MADFDITDSPGDDDIAALERGLTEHAKSQNAPPEKKQKLGLFHRDAEGRILAGLFGYTFWDLLYVDTLWVDKTLRGQEIGSKLMLTAEKEALKRGCHSAYLWTQSWEGPDFYPKLGYKKFVVNEEVPRGHQRTGFMKRLAA